MLSRPTKVKAEITDRDRTGCQTSDWDDICNKEAGSCSSPGLPHTTSAAAECRCISSVTDEQYGSCSTSLRLDGREFHAFGSTNEKLCSDIQT